jgi:hydrogenase expression/formation protein HypE
VPAAEPTPAFEQLVDAGLLRSAGPAGAHTDAFVVRRSAFPWLDRRAAVNGTVNDLAVTGARPLALSVALVLEEGLPADGSGPR